MQDPIVVTNQVGQGSLLQTVPHGGRVQITTQTMQQAPGNPSDARRTVAVGEFITLTASRPGEWNISGETISGRRRSVNKTWEEPGVKMVRVETPQGNAALQIRVVAPSIRVRKLAEVPISTGVGIGAYMRLEFRLTPLGVSFSHLMVKEQDCDPTNLWGYFATHQATLTRAMHHQAVQEWSTVDSNNVVMTPDNARWVLSPSDMAWPLTAGGFTWRIPDVYQIGQNEHHFARNMTQTFRMVPTRERPPFKGTVTIWKGGQSVEQVYD